MTTLLLREKQITETLGDYKSHIKFSLEDAALLGGEVQRDADQPIVDKLEAERDAFKGKWQGLAVIIGQLEAQLASYEKKMLTPEEMHRLVDKVAVLDTIYDSAVAKLQAQADRKEETK